MGKLDKAVVRLALGVLGSGIRRPGASQLVMTDRQVSAQETV